MVWHIYRFSRCRFDRFWSLLMYSQSYIFILEITVIPMPFLFLIISKRFHFQWKNKSESDGTFYRLFPTVFIPTIMYIFISNEYNTRWYVCHGCHLSFCYIHDNCFERYTWFCFLFKKGYIYAGISLSDFLQAFSKIDLIKYDTFVHFFLF